MRDHRKIAFRDISEQNPFAGGAILTGMGVGQHYLGPDGTTARFSSRARCCWSSSRRHAIFC